MTASFVYKKIQTYFASVALDWTDVGVPITLLFIDESHYVPNRATNQFLADIPGLAKLGTPTLLTGRTTSLDVPCDAADTAVPVPNGTAMQAAVVYINTGDPATSRLIFYISLGSNTLTNGNPVTVVWPATGVGRP